MLQVFNPNELAQLSKDYIADISGDIYDWKKKSFFKTTIRSVKSRKNQ